jgi:hypothetical protein
MNALADLLAQIPATFWSFIIAGLFTLSASLSSIFLTNRAHDSRLRTQLAHDRDLKNRDREMALRRDIYLAAAEAAAAGLIAVGRFANLDVSDEKLTEGYLDKAPSLTKVPIIAKEETVRAVTNFSVELNAAFLILFARRLPLVLQKQHISFLSGQIDIFTKEQSRMLELMKQYNMDGINDPHRWDMIQHTFDFERSRVEQTTQEIKTLNASLIPEQLKFMEEVYDEMIKLGRFLTPALFTIRKELELPLDETEFRRISEEATARQVESLTKFMQQVRSLIAAQTAAAGDAPPPPDS